MMHTLEVPLQLAGFRIHSHRGVAEQINPRPVSAIEVGARSADWQIQNAAILIESQRKGPDVVACAIFPTVVAPGVVTSLTGARDGMELPQFFA